jgi:predicted lipoprotein with Yx(FWY)xxD motif
MPTTLREDTMHTRTLAAVTLAGAALLAACGGGGSAAPQVAGSSGGAQHHAPAATIAVRSTALGDVLVDAHGRTLYGFTNDTAGTSTCTGVCAAEWPPLNVTAGWTSGTGVDRATFHTVARGTDTQLVAGRWPLYRFVGDRRPGDVTGQGVESFFVVRADGSLFKGTAAPTGAPSPMPAMSGRGY